MPNGVGARWKPLTKDEKKRMARERESDERIVQRTSAERQRKSLAAYEAEQEQERGNPVEVDIQLSEHHPAVKLVTAAGRFDKDAPSLEVLQGEYLDGGPEMLKVGDVLVGVGLVREGDTPVKDVNGRVVRQGDHYARYGVVKADGRVNWSSSYNATSPKQLARLLRIVHARTQDKMECEVQAPEHMMPGAGKGPRVRGVKRNSEGGGAPTIYARGSASSG